jgi:hypothetical protein
LQPQCSINWCFGRLIVFQFGVSQTSNQNRTSTNRSFNVLYRLSQKLILFNIVHINKSVKSQVNLFKSSCLSFVSDRLDGIGYQSKRIAGRLQNSKQIALDVQL